MSNLLTSREFWVTMLALVVIIVASFQPGFAFEIVKGR